MSSKACTAFLGIAINVGVRRIWSVRFPPLFRIYEVRMEAQSEIHGQNHPLRARSLKIGAKFPISREISAKPHNLFSLRDSYHRIDARMDGI